MRLSTALASTACFALLGAAAWQTWPRWTWRLSPPPPEVVFHQAVQPFIVRNCLECHDDATRKGAFSLETLAASPSLLDKRETWERVLRHVELGLMPPVEHPQPVPRARSEFVRWLDRALHPIDPARPDPGRVVIRRLSRGEYANTVRDALGVDFSAADFPEDDTGYGFDNIGDVLNTSPLLFERLLSAARAISEAAITNPFVPLQTWTLPTESWDAGGAPLAPDGLLFTNSRITRTFVAPAEGRYKLTFILAQDPRPGPEPARAEIRLGDHLAARLDADAPRHRPRRRTVELTLPRGPQPLSLDFINDYFSPATAERRALDRNLLFLGLEIEGPFDPRPLPPTPAQLALLGPAPAADAPDSAWIHASLEKLARRLFRRDATPDELTRLAALVARERAAGGTRESGLQVALQAMLVSPSFLYRGEPAVTPAPAHEPVFETALPISEHALASRLSYFLWAGPPDDRLLELARAGKLRASFPAEVDRLLADPRSGRFLESFAGQWLLVRNLRLRHPDPKLFPTWDASLATSLEREVLLFVGDFLTNKRPVVELLTARDTFMDERLAAHYGVPRPASAGHAGSAAFVRTPLPEGRRAGLLGLPGILAVSAYPNRTSPVLRGKFVLEQILGTPPPPPPPNIPSLAEAAPGEHAAPTLRQRLETHRSAPSCAACHAFIDPLGFSLEGFAADGRARATDEGKPIDTDGRLETGETVRSPEDLAAVLAATRADQFRRNLATQLLTFALGRGLDYYDRPALEKIVREARAAGDTLPAYLHAITLSLPFRYQRPPVHPSPATATPPTTPNLALNSPNPNVYQ